ncbi:ATP-dependent DNA helicase RecG [Euzebya tangerina]|uniref:ATP-dependent DNA helicase RecG n=1 Tax=Euzebya tangerina TaxID=591198 RepID=UPI0013C2DD5F|nr:ATP-dependent DNA helicase RecG [Euzebya tangerina]
MELSLEDPVGRVPGVTGKLQSVLAQPPFIVTTVRDLIWYLPRQDAYKDLGATQPVADMVVGEPATVIGTIHRWERVFPKKRGRGGKQLTIQRAHVRDDQGGRLTVAFFNQPRLPTRHSEGSQVAISGTVENFRGQLQLKGPKLVGLDGSDGAEPLTDGHLQPVYRATEKLGSPRIARLIAEALALLPPLVDHLPEELRNRHELARLDWAIRAIHQPADGADLRLARQRLVYDELLGLQLVLQRRRRELEEHAKGLINAPAAGGAVDAFRATLPFDPTGDQQRAFDQLDADLASEAPMHRLLQGDVGTGKTIVAAHAMLRAVDAGRQAVLMAPTQVLAEQHLTTFSDLLARTVIPRLGRPPRLRILSANLTKAQRATVLQETITGECDLLIGTHAVLEDNVVFADLGVVVIDEQHRFGVGHRATLASKRDDGATPDVLVMTATPIPRSLALTMYGDLDVTVLRTRPGADTITVTTTVLATDSPRREKLYDFVRAELDAGRKAYVVCPLIEESEALEGVTAATVMYEELASGPFAGYEVGLMHGRMAAEDRDAVMAAFRDGSVPLLVATTVIEVGVSVDEASVMIIEDADRFGISQLHQLRGRLFRGHPTNYCVLFSADPVDNPRLEALATSDDGFELAEEDLRLRREGKILDTAQTGETDLRIASLIADVDVVATTRDDARELLEDDTSLSRHPAMAAELRRRYDPEDLAALEAG